VVPDHHGARVRGAIILQLVSAELCLEFASHQATEIPGERTKALSSVVAACTEFPSAPSCYLPASFQLLPRRHLPATTGLACADIALHQRTSAGVVAGRADFDARRVAARPSRKGNAAELRCSFLAGRMAAPGARETGRRQAQHGQLMGQHSSKASRLLAQ